MSENTMPRVAVSELVDGNAVLYVMVTKNREGELVATLLVDGYPVAYADEQSGLTVLFSEQDEWLSPQQQSVVRLLQHIKALPYTVTRAWLSGSDHRELAELLSTRTSGEELANWMRYARAVAKLLRNVGLHERASRAVAQS